MTDLKNGVKPGPKFTSQISHGADLPRDEHPREGRAGQQATGRQDLHFLGDIPGGERCIGSWSPGVSSLLLHDRGYRGRDPHRTGENLEK